MRPNRLFCLQAYSLHSNNLSMSFFFIQIYVKCCHIFLGFLVMQTLYVNKVFSIPFSALNIWEFVVAICRSILPWLFAAGIWRGLFECVKVPIPAHQVLPLKAYIFEAKYSMSATQANKIQSMDQSEVLNLWAGIGTLTYCFMYAIKFLFVYVTKYYLYASKTFFFMRAKRFYLWVFFLKVH